MKIYALRSRYNSFKRPVTRKIGVNCRFVKEKWGGEGRCLPRTEHACVCAISSAPLGKSSENGHRERRHSFEVRAVCGENPPTPPRQQSTGRIRMKNALRITAVALGCVALVACSQRGPAEAALKAAEASTNEIRPEGSKYAPEQTKGVLTSFASAQDSFNRGDYKVAMEIAQGTPAKSKDVAAAIAAKKAELGKAWADLSGVPAMVDQIRAKVEALGAMKKLPKDMDASKLEAAKASLADMTKIMGEASEAFKSGNLMDAVTKGNAVKAKAPETMAALALTAGAPAVPPPAAPAPKAALKKAKPAKK